MKLNEFVSSSQDFFDYLEKSLKSMSLILIGSDHASYLQKTRSFWQAINEYGKHSAEFKPLNTTRAFYIAFRGITGYIEVCFENQPLEFFKVVKSSRKKIFASSENFIDLDELLQEDDIQETQDDNHISIVRAEAKDKIIKAVELLKQQNLDDEEVRDILNKIITEIFE